MIKCNKCGAEIPEKSKFCLECGNPVASAQGHESKKYKPRPMHYAYGNNQSCAGKADVVVRNGFVYYISREENAIYIKVSPLSDNDMVQTLYMSAGPGCRASCLNMVDDELIFYEYANGHKISAIDVYSGEKRSIIEGHEASSIWIENKILMFVENGQLRSIHINAEDYHEYNLPFEAEDRIFGYGGSLYVISKNDREVYEIPYEKDEIRKMEIIAGEDMIYGIIGNLYYSPIAENPENGVIFCKNIDSLEIRNGIENVDRMITAFEQYVIFSRINESRFSFAWNIQTLRVYSLNRHIDLPPYSFVQALSDYIIIEYSKKIYKVPAPVFFQGDEPMFDEKYVFSVL